MFGEIKSYMESLSRETDVISNFEQGSLWKEKIAGETKLILPLFGYFDDFQTGNALGSHAVSNKLGAFYYNLPCLPPEHQSKLENIFLCLLFYSLDRQELGNFRIFKVVID